MRRLILFFLVFLLAAGTVGDPIAHAIEGANEVSAQGIAATPSFVLGLGVDRDAADQDASTSGKKEPMPAGGHACHGHHSGIPALTPAAQHTPLFPAIHKRALTAALPAAAYIGTFRPPIS